VDLQYNTSYLTAQEIQYGPAFTQELTGTIDDNLGRVSAIGGATTLTNVGDDARVLLARVRFASTGSDQVPVDEAGRNIGPYNMQFALANGQTQLAGADAAVTDLAAPPATALWAVMYDLDDNHLIDFGDLSFFAAAFGRTVGLPSSEPPYAWWADFDKSGLVDFGDLSFLAANFGKGRAAGQPIGFPPSFPNGWASASEPRQGDTLGGDRAVVVLADPRLPCDVNGDGRVAPLDALILVNALNLLTAWGLPSVAPSSGAQPPYLDPTGDGHLTPADVLQVINYLNGAECSLDGEGEAWGNAAADGSRAALSFLLVAPWSHEASGPGLLPGQPQGDSQRTLAAEDRDLPLDAERSEEGAIPLMRAESGKMGYR
jgi:alkaline phosphatase